MALGTVHGTLVINPNVPRASGLIFTADPEVLAYFHRWADRDFTARRFNIIQEDSGLMWTGTFHVSAFEKTVQLQSSGDLVSANR